MTSRARIILGAGISLLALTAPLAANWQSTSGTLCFPRTPGAEAVTTADFEYDQNGLKNISETKAFDVICPAFRDEASQATPIGTRSSGTELYVQTAYQGTMSATLWNCNKSGACKSKGAFTDPTSTASHLRTFKWGTTEGLQYGWYSFTLRLQPLSQLRGFRINEAP